eukprot:151385-Pelagomonas_calceolata.AAC.3
MGREPLGLPASGEVHTWLPWPAQRTPRPETRHAGKTKRFRQYYSVAEQKMANMACPAHPPPWNSVNPQKQMSILLFGPAEKQL